MNKMHINELEINLELARELINEQFPQFSGLTITRVNSVGTVNHIFRLGQDFYMRLPRIMGGKDLDKESKWLPLLKAHLPLRIPFPVAIGQATPRYPAKWAIYNWINGSDYTDELIIDETQAARDLARFVNALHAIEVPSDAPGAGRLPLLKLNTITEEAVMEAQDILDADKVLAAWHDSCTASAWDGQPVWIHADLLRSNLLVNEGRLAAVIDFGSAGVGDPAFDLIPAWAVFNSRGREAFRDAIDADNDTWLRARAYALHQAALIVPYYRETNPRFVNLAIRTINEILADIPQTD